MSERVTGGYSERVANGYHWGSNEKRKVERKEKAREREEWKEGSATRVLVVELWSLDYANCCMRNGEWHSSKLSKLSSKINEAFIQLDSCILPWYASSNNLNVSCRKHYESLASMISIVFGSGSNGIGCGKEWKAVMKVVFHLNDLIVIIRSR